MSDVKSAELVSLIYEGTAATTGAEFFPALVRSVARALDAYNAFLSRFDAACSRAEVLANWVGEALVPQAPFALDGTPCELVLKGEPVAFARGVQDRFPRDREALAALRAESYLAIPLIDSSGRAVGHLAVIDQRQREWKEDDIGVLRIFAARATAEILRLDHERTLLAANETLAREIESRVRAEDALRLSEQMYRDLYDDAPDVYLSVGTDGRIRRANRRAAQLFGYGIEELTGRPIFTLYADTPSGVGQARKVFERFLAGQEVFGEEVEMVRSDGGTIWGSISVKPIFNDRGEVEATRSIITDITDRKRVELALKHRLDLEALIAAISTRFVSVEPGGIAAELEWALGQVGRFIDSDRALLYRFTGDGSFARLLHDWVRDPSRPAGSRLAEFRRNEVPDVFDFFLSKRRINSPRPDTLPPGFAILNELPGAERVQSRIAVPIISGSDSVGILCFHSIIVERNWPEEDLRLLGLLGEIVGTSLARAEAEAAVQHAREVAESASRAKSDFLARMSHELRTPLNGILGYAPLLRRDDSLGGTQRESIEAIERCGEHLLTLINEVLDLAKIEAGRDEVEISQFDPGELICDVAQITRVRATQAGLAFSVQIDSSLPALVTTDQRKLRQVLLNLLGNAVKFTERGSVFLRVNRRGGADGHAHLRFEIEDTGMGIAPADIERIFEPFQQLHTPGRRVEGTGLGLAICRKLVLGLGGRLDVASIPGRGSTFSVELALPATEMPMVATLPRRPQVIGYEGRRRQILIVDDTLDNRNILRSFLCKLDFRTSEATNGAEAVEVATKQPPDLILMDLVMPVMDGFETIRRLRQITALAAVPIVALSASAFEVTRANCEQAGANDFLAKPVKLEELLAVLERHLRLQWQLEAPAPSLAAHRTSAEDVTAGPVVPASCLPQQLARELYELALMGDVRELTGRLASLDDSESLHLPIVGELRTLAHNFDMKAIRAALRPIVGA